LVFEHLFDTVVGDVVDIRGRMGHREVTNATNGAPAPRDGQDRDADPPARAGAASPGLADALQLLGAAVDAVARTDLDGLAEPELELVLRGVRQPLAQLEGLRARAAAVQQVRRLSGRGSSSADAALAEHRRALGEQQRLAPSETGRLLDAGRVAAAGTVTGAALTGGRIGLSQARTIGRVLASLIGRERDEVEAELVALAECLDPVAFGRAARAVQARLRPEQLARMQRREGFDRRFRATDTDDGGFAFSGLLYGAAAETARVAVQAFRRPDAPDEHRTPEQRGADAFEQLCAAALSSGVAPTRHGVRPQVLVTIDAADLALLEELPDRAAGTFVGSGQPISGRELRHLVADSQLVRIVLDAHQVPVEVSTTVRTVPAGLWRALLVRDGGCVWPGCDAPASWCDVAHALDAYADDGRLRLDNAMLLCRRHHRRFDTSNMTVRIDGPTVHFPQLGPSADPDPDPASAPVCNTPSARAGDQPSAPPGAPPSSPLSNPPSPSSTGSSDPPTGGVNQGPAVRERRGRMRSPRASPTDRQLTLHPD